MLLVLSNLRGLCWVDTMDDEASLCCVVSVAELPRADVYGGCAVRCEEVFANTLRKPFLPVWDDAQDKLLRLT